MAKGQGEFGWIFTGVRVGSHRYLLAVTMAGGDATVITVKMQG